MQHARVAFESKTASAAGTIVRLDVARQAAAEHGYHEASVLVSSNTTRVLTPHRPWGSMLDELGGHQPH